MAYQSFDLATYNSDLLPLMPSPAGIDFFECGRYNHNIDRDFQGCKR